MEEYINLKTIIKDENYELHQEFIICSICELLMIEPIICSKCGKRFCKNCIEYIINKKYGNCPYGCQDPIFKEVIIKNNFITKCKFKCIKGCNKEILFNDIKNHYSSDCLLFTKKKNIFLTPEEVEKYKEKNGEDIQNLTSKYNNN